MRKLFLALLSVLLSLSSFAQKTAEDATLDAVYYDAVRARIHGDDKQAAKLFQQYLEKRPNEPAAYYELSRLAIKIKDPEQATRYIKQAVALDNSNKWYKEQYANILADRAQYKEAALLFHNLAETQRTKEDYLLKEALLYQRGGDYKKSLIALDKLAALDQDNEEILLQKEQVQIKLKDNEGAAATLRQLIDRNPKDGRFYALLAELYENNKDYDKEEETFNTGITKLPNDPSLQIALAAHYKKNKDLKKYHEFLEKAITNKDLDAETQISLLLPYIQQLQEDSVHRDDGIALAKKIAMLHPGDAQIISFYGQVLSINNKPEEAAVQLKKSLAIDPARYDTWVRLLSLMSEPRYADSLLKYSEKAMRLYPNQAVIHYLHGVAQYNKKNYPATIADLNRALEYEGGSGDQVVQIYSLLGDVYNTQKQFKLSDSVFETALKIDPRNSNILNNYSYYLSVRGARLNDAERMSKRSLEISPEIGTYLDTYGWILYKQNKYEDALEYISKAISLSGPTPDATLYEHLGDVFYKLGNTDKALENWKKSKEKGNVTPEINKKIADKKLYE